MYDLDTIKSRGREWRKGFADTQFVGELEVSESEIKQLCPAVGKWIFRASWDEDICAALAVAVVNLAYYYPEEVGDGFRWHVLHKLLGRKSKDVHVWQEQIGEPVLRLLGRHFQAKDIPGPFRYVRPIMLQAGVPARLADRFAHFFLELVQSYGWHFTEAEYTACHEKAKIQSFWLASFLQVNGWQYCRDIARIIKYLDEGVLNEADIRGLLPRFKIAVESIRQLMAKQGRIDKGPPSYPKPQLVLDGNSLRLAIEFAEKGLNGQYQWADGRRIRTSRYILKEEDFFGSLSGRIAQPNGRIEPWSIKAWLPTPGSWATFRVNDNSLETHSNGAQKIRPGRHLVAFAAPFAIPQEHIVEEYGELYVPGYDSVMVTVADCELPGGFRVDASGFSVSEALSDCLPTLRFVSSRHALPYTKNVFISELPEIRIENWTDTFANRYFLLHEHGSHRQRLAEASYLMRENLQLRVSSPAKGKLYIEPKGRAPNGFLETSLSYVVLPEAAIAWPTGLHEPSEMLVIEIKPANKLEVDWGECLLNQFEPGRWRVPAQTDFADGQVSYDGGVSFSIAGPISRLRITGDCLQNGILWQDNLKDRSQLRISLSNEEVNRRVEIGVADESGFVKCLDLGPVASSGMLQITTDSIRDAFNTRGLPAGRIAVRLPSLRVVRSDEIFLHDAKIRERLFTDADAEFQLWIKSVSEKLRPILTSTREMGSRPVQEFSLHELILPQHLCEFLSFFQACACVFDWKSGGNALSEELDHNLRICLLWYMKSKKFIEEDKTLNPEVAQRLLRDRPRIINRVLAKVKNTPNLRWRSEIAHLIGLLRKRKSVGDYKRIVREWAEHCRLGRWHSAFQCEIGRAPGGGELTNAAIKYCHAFEELEYSNVVKSKEYFIAAKLCFDSAQKLASDGLVAEIASALRVMTFFHAGHNQFSLEADQLLTFLSSHWARFKLILSRLSGRTWNGEIHEDSLALSDISPHTRDIMLEESCVS